MVKTKIEWISTFRKVGDSILVELSKTKKSKNDKASENLFVLKYAFSIEGADFDKYQD